MKEFPLQRIAGKTLRIMDFCLAALVGFAFSFTVFFLLTVFPLGSFLRGALLEETEPLRTLSLTAQNERFAAATQALVSFWWWTAVLVASVIVTSYLLRGLRR